MLSFASSACMLPFFKTKTVENLQEKNNSSSKCHCLIKKVNTEIDSESIREHLHHAYLSSYGDRAFSNPSPRLWNSLPQHFKDTHLTNPTSSQTHLFRLAYIKLLGEIFFLFLTSAFERFTDKVRFKNVVFYC